MVSMLMACGDSAKYSVGDVIFQSTANSGLGLLTASSSALIVEWDERLVGKRFKVKGTIVSKTKKLAFEETTVIPLSRSVATISHAEYDELDDNGEDIILTCTLVLRYNRVDALHKQFLVVTSNSMATNSRGSDYDIPTYISKITIAA